MDIHSDTAPPIILNVWDRDSHVGKDSFDFLGRAAIFPKDANFSTDESIPEPKWHKIKMSFEENAPHKGKILVSFSIIDPAKLEFQKHRG